MSNKMLCHKKQDIRDSSRIMELSITVKQLIIKVKQVYFLLSLVTGRLLARELAYELIIN
jgi:hypothetical protein